MKLSILDQAPVVKGSTKQEALEATIDLAIEADKRGFYRYWVAEHHDLPGLASPAPDILLGIIGSRTSQIRLGAGAVLLPNYRPYNVAERYHLLSTLYPGRIDIGLGRAPGGSAETTIALAGNFLEKVKEMPERIDELQHFLQQDFPKGHLYHSVTAEPIPEKGPVPWLLGTSGKSAKLAADKGLPYVFGHFMTNKDGPAIMKEYLQNTKQPERGAFIAISVICAETDEEAEELAKSNFLWKILRDQGKGKDGVPAREDVLEYDFSEDELQKLEEMKENQIIGSPAVVKKKIDKLAEAYQVNEVMIVTITHDYETRKHSYRLLADCFSNSNEEI